MAASQIQKWTKNELLEEKIFKILSYFQHS